MIGKPTNLKVFGSIKTKQDTLNRLRSHMCEGGVSPELWLFSTQVQKRYAYVNKYQDNLLKISFCFQTGDTIVSYVSTRGF